MWRGAISFGLVNIGVRPYAATADHDYRFHQVHREDGASLGVATVAAACLKCLRQVLEGGVDRDDQRASHH